MRLLRWCLFLALTLPLAAESVRLQHVWPGYRSASSFVRIGEYFGFTPHESRRPVLRSQPDERAGFYWLVRTRATAAMPDASIELQVILPGQDRPTTHTFPTPLPDGSHATIVGLTGADWPDKNARPLAWKLRVLGPDNRELDAENSFLWSLPTDSVSP